MQHATLEALLAGFAPVDAQEERHHARMLMLLEQGRHCWQRDHLQPGHFTASAFVLAPNGRDVLMIFHSKLKRWLQPGGHIEAADLDVIAAAKREVTEEAGIPEAALEVEIVNGSPIFDLDVHTIPGSAKRGESAHEHFDVRVLLRSTQAEVQAGSDVTQVRWVPLDDQSFASETDESVLRALRKLQRLRTELSKPSDQTREHLRERLQTYALANGLRSTAQRRNIVDTFFATTQHVTIEELLALVRKRDRGVGYATVYRTLKLLVEAGVAAEHRFEDGLSRYELADEATTHHDHLICVDCGRIVEFEEPQIEALQLAAAKRLGFSLSSHRLEMYGHCEQLAQCPHRRALDAQSGSH